MKWPNTLLSTMLTEIVILSLLCDTASSAAVGSTSAAARLRRQIPETADGPTADDGGEDRPSGSLLVRAWLRAAAARDRQRLYDSDHGDEGTDMWKRQFLDDDEDFILVRRRSARNSDFDFPRRHSAAPPFYVRKRVVCCPLDLYCTSCDFKKK